MQNLLKKYDSLTNCSKNRKYFNRWGFNLYLKKKCDPYLYLDNPYEISWQVTSRCNLKCDYCYANTVNDLKKSNEECSTQECYDIIEKLFISGCKEITLEGGEPFVRKDILDIIKRIKSKNFFLDILTNGFLITDEIIDELSKVFNNKFDGLQISIDNFKDNGVHPKLKTIISNLIKNNINVRVNIVLTYNNIDKLNLMYNQVKLLGVKNGFNVSQIIPIGGGKNIEKPSTKELLESFIKLKQIEDDKLPILGMPIMIKTHKLYNPNYVKTKIHNCTAARIKLNISSNGLIYPCAFLQYDEFLLGDIKNHTLNSIWNGNKCEKFRNRLIEERKNKICINKQFCNGGCMGVAYQENKNFGCCDSRCLLKCNEGEV